MDTDMDTSSTDTTDMGLGSLRIMDTEVHRACWADYLVAIIMGMGMGMDTVMDMDMVTVLGRPIRSMPLDLLHRDRGDMDLGPGTMDITDMDTTGMDIMGMGITMVAVGEGGGMIARESLS